MCLCCRRSVSLCHIKVCLSSNPAALIGGLAECCRVDLNPVLAAGRIVSQITSARRLYGFAAALRASLLAKIATSIRRLAARPPSVSLLATGSVSPSPRVAMRAPFTPCEMR